MKKEIKEKLRRQKNWKNCSNNKKEIKKIVSHCFKFNYGNEQRERKKERESLANAARTQRTVLNTITQFKPISHAFTKEKEVGGERLVLKK